jgi:group II intron reverse transcriptase/maturase
MRNAETITGIIWERGKKGLPLEDVYRQLYNPDLYLRAYGKIYRNDGAMTPGSTPETVDAMSQDKIEGTIKLLREEKYQWTPVRRVYIGKKNSTKKRPLGMPTWSDKLLQEVMRSLLEAYYEPQFSTHSHGFRPNRGCHTALAEIKRVWRGTTWFIEGDIKGCFDNIDHTILLSILREKIHDNRFLRLVENLLKAGYLEKWQYNATYSGTPQGGIISPLLANIFLDRLDRFVENELLPAYNRGKARKMSPRYTELIHRQQKAKQNGDRKALKEIRKKLFTMPAVVLNDPNYRRLRYVRYADDFLLGFVGPREEAEEIKGKIKEFLQEQLNLDCPNRKP